MLVKFVESSERLPTTLPIAGNVQSYLPEDSSLVDDCLDGANLFGQQPRFLFAHKALVDASCFKYEGSCTQVGLMTVPSSAVLSM